MYEYHIYNMYQMLLKMKENIIEDKFGVQFFLDILKQHFK